MNEFIPYQYRPRFSGPAQPMVTQPQGGDQGQELSMEDLFAKVGTVGHISRSFNLSSLLDPITLATPGKTVFLMFPGDIALQRAIFAWSRSADDAGQGNTTVDITIKQYRSFNTAGITELNLFPIQMWHRAQFGQAAILEPIGQIEPYTPIVATIRCLNSTSPPTPAFFELEDLELWMTIHFLAGETA